MKKVLMITFTSGLLVLSACVSVNQQHNESRAFVPEDGKTWLAGDHHIHGKYSARWNWKTQPPSPLLFGDAHYFTALNAKMAAFHQLDWMVTTDHGGPNHSAVNRNSAYPELVASRVAIPEIMQFYGMEFDTPGARHSTLIIPKSEKEADQLFELESQYNRREIYPDESPRDTQAFMLSALEAMQKMSPQPVLLVNHPARKATDLNVYQKVTPQKMREWQDIAPDVVTGMTAIPGHQAASINPDGTNNPRAPRAEYFGYPTHGGTDQMSAIVGGVWDKLLAEGRKWTVTAVSDSHAHYTEGRTDFWPGEYAKTYVRAARDYDSVLDGLREGNVFIVTGDLIDELYVSVEHGAKRVNIGGTLALDVNNKAPITVTVAFHDPQGANFNRQYPTVERLDIIYGDVVGKYPQTEKAPVKVIHRFFQQDWERQGAYNVVQFSLPAPDNNAYIRVRGTNLKEELEPEVDPKGENPWDDLWFYSNPVYLHHPNHHTSRYCNEFVTGECDDK